MNESIQLIVSKIEELIVAVGGKVQSYYPYVVRQQIIQGAIIVVGFIVSLIVLGIGLKLGIKCKWNGDPLETIAISLSIIGGIGTVILFFVMLFEGLPQLLNPNYYAVKDIIAMGTRLLK